MQRERKYFLVSPSGTRNGSSRARGAGRKLSAPSGRTPPMASRLRRKVKAKKIDASGEAPMDFETDFSATPTFAIED